MITRSTASRRLAAASLLAAAPSTFAHHPMDGQTPLSLLDGFLSGLGHPLIEPAHALFLAGAAVLVAVSGLRLHKALALLVLHVLASVAGTALTLPHVAAEAVQWGLAASLLLLVPGLWTGRLPDVSGAWALAPVTGLVHGLAFGEAVIGAEQTPMLAYLGGLALMQSSVMAGLCAASRRAMLRVPRLTTAGARTLAGGLVAGGIALATGGL